MTDETTPASPADRSWAAETGWPEAGSTPSWAELPGEDDSAEDEYDAWLDAQEPAAEDEAGAGGDPEPAQAGGAPEPGSAPSLAPPLAQGARAGEAPAQTQAPAPGDAEAGPLAQPASAELVEDTASDPEAGLEPVEAAAGEPEAMQEPSEEPVEVEAPVVVPDALEAAATPLAVEPVEPESELVEPELEPDAGVEGEAEPVADLASRVAGEPALAVTGQTTPEQALEEAAQEAAEEPAAEEEAAPAVPAWRSGTALVAPLAALVVVLLALTALLGVWAARTSSGGAAEDARRDALAAARKAAHLLFSYDYRHLDKDFAAGKAMTTGQFATDYARTTSKIIDDVAPRYKAVVSARVSEAGVISSSTSKVEVLLFVDQQSTSTLAAGQKITQSRLTMTLEKKGGRWLVSRVNAF
jgi:Mce-associated membrane protein